MGLIFALLILGNSQIVDSMPAVALGSASAHGARHLPQGLGDSGGGSVRLLRDRGRAVLFEALEQNRQTGLGSIFILGSKTFGICLRVENDKAGWWCTWRPRGSYK